MPARFCDKTPCPPLKKAFDVLLPQDAKGEQFEFIVLPAPSELPPQRVFFEYCPFCGTRIDPEWLENALCSRG
jgi:hypothetical protein